MDITITINTDNAAFGEWPEQEAARILAALANKIRTEMDFSDKRVGANEFSLRDINGNTVGKMEVSE